MLKWNSCIASVNFSTWSKNDLVIVPSITFVATYNAVLMAGAQPIISDVDSETGLVNLRQVEELMKIYGEKLKLL